MPFCKDILRKIISFLLKTIPNSKERFDSRWERIGFSIRRFCAVISSVAQRSREIRNARERISPLACGPMWGVTGAPPVAEKATKASGSGRQSTQAKAKENAGHRNRTSPRKCTVSCGPSRAPAPTGEMTDGGVEGLGRQRE